VRLSCDSHLLFVHSSHWLHDPHLLAKSFSISR
jgi:hypothetical protein